MSKVVHDQLGARFRHHAKNIQRDLESGMVEAALRGEALVAADTPVNTGLARAAWRVRITPRGADLVNDAPHAGVLELGSRPHTPPYFPILQWVVSKEGGGTISSEDDATPEQRSKAWAIVNHIKKHGTKPKRMVGRNLPLMAKLAEKISKSRISARIAKEG